MLVLKNSCIPEKRDYDNTNLLPSNVKVQWNKMFSENLMRYKFKIDKGH